MAASTYAAVNEKDNPPYDTELSSPWKNGLDMDATMLFKLLTEGDSAICTEILLALRQSLRQNEAKTLLRGPDCFLFFDVLAQILGDQRSDVCFECLQLIGTVIPLIGDELDRCLLHIMPQVLSVFSRESLELREATVQVLHMYMRYTNNWHHFMRSFAQNGLNNSDFLIKKGCLKSIDFIFNEEFASENLLLLVEALIRLLVSGDNRTLYTTLIAIQNLSRRLGPVIFEFYLKRLDESLRLLYLQILHKANSQETAMALQHSEPTLNGLQRNGNVSFIQNPLLQRPVLNYGLFESTTLEKLKQNEWRSRVEGVEHLKQVLRDTNDLSPLVPNLDRFFTLLSRLLGDTCFKVVILTLNVYEIIISRLKHKLTRHIKAIVSALAKHLGDLRVVVKEHNVKVLHKVMCETHPKVILDILLEQRANRNPRMREEVLNRVTAALLTFPSYNFDLFSLCQAITPSLIDSKRRVRLAALECIAVLAQTMGSSRMTPLLSAIYEIDMSAEDDGLQSAVHARLSRKILPRCTVDGMIIYAISIPNSANVQARSPYSAGADINWIMAAHGTTGSLTPPSVRAQAPELPELTKQPRNHYRKPEDEIVKASKVSVAVEEVYAGYSAFSDKETERPLSRHWTEDQTYEPEVSEMQDEEKTVRSIEKYVGDKIDQTEELLELLSTTAGTEEKPRSGRINDPIRTAPERLLNMTWPGTSNPSQGIQEEPPLPTRPVLAGRNSATSSMGGMRRASRLSRSVPSTAVGPREGSSSLPPVVIATSPMLKPKKKGFVESRVTSAASIAAQQLLLLTRSKSFDYGKLKRGFSTFSDTEELSTLFGGRPLLANSPRIQTNHNRSQSAKNPHPSSVEARPETLEGNLRLPALEGASQERVSSSPPLPPTEVIPLTPAPRSPVQVEENDPESDWEYEDDFESASEDSVASSSGTGTESDSEETPSDAGANRTEVSMAEEEDEDQTYNNRDLEVEAETGEASLAAPPSGPLRKSCSTNAIDLIRSTADDSFQQLGNTSSFRSKTMSSKIRPPGFQKIPVPVKSSSSLGLLVPGMELPPAAAGRPEEEWVLDELLRPLAGSPGEAVRNALKDMQSEEWNLKIEGMKTVRILCTFHTSVLCHALQPLLHALVQEVSNLRSTVSRYAIATVGYMATKIKRILDPELDLVISVLLRKSGENTGFIREDVEHTLGQVVDNVTLQKVALALLAGGAKHRNEFVRKTGAQFLSVVVEKMGPSRCIGTKELAEKLFPATAQFATDKNPLTRYYGRKILHEMLLHPDFMRLLHRYLQPNVIKGLNNILEAIRKKGPGEGPKESPRGSVQSTPQATPRKLMRPRENSRSRF